MTDNEKDIVDTLIPYMAMFPDCRLDSQGLRLYACSLNEYPAIKVRLAMQKLIKKTKFFPRVADIVEAMNELQEYADRTAGKGVLTSGEAWEDVQRELRRRSFYSSEPWQFASKEVEKAARQFGLEELATLEMNAVNTARAQFMRIYDSIINAKKQNDDNKKLLAVMSDDVKRLVFGTVKQIEKGGKK